MPFYFLKEMLAKKIEKACNHAGVTCDTVMGDLTVPPSLDHGHLSLPCFRLAKLLNQKANEVSKELAGKFEKEPLMISANALGPYVNFTWHTPELYEKTLSTLFSERDKYGSASSHKEKPIVFEFCSPNIAKRLAFQHIRSTLIGNTLANIYEFCGFSTLRINFVGDWGSQFGRLLAAIDRWGQKELVHSSDRSAVMGHLFDLYVRFHKESQQDTSLIEASQRWLQRMETNDEEAVALWQRVREVSVGSMCETLKRMSIRFDFIEGESLYIPLMTNTLAQVKEKGSAKLSEGAWIIDVEGISTPALIQKRDGTTLYLTRDIAAAIDRYQRFCFDRMFYVVSEQQKLHFQLLFGVLKKMGLEWSSHCEHLSFGTVLFGAEKMSTREGNVIFLDQLLDEAKRLALEVCTEKNPDLKDKDEVAEMIGVGAVIFGELSSHRQRDIQFNWKDILALDGETGPYVQYSLVRCRSLLRKAVEEGVTVPAQAVSISGYPFTSEEEALTLALAKFRGALFQCLRENEPYHLTHYLIDAAKVFNKFYYRLPVIQAANPAQRAVRLTLVWGTEQTLKNGLALLGMKSPQEM